MPLAPDMIVTGPLGMAVHVHELFEALTANVPVPPDVGTDAPVGSKVNVQVIGTAAAWLTVYGWPPMVKVPFRAAPALGCTV
jgi:hypothetical protein